MKINRENCEAWFLDYYEGNLSKEGAEEMYAFLILNPDMREVFDSYDEVSFSPDNKVRFEGKMDLKKSEEQLDGINESNYEDYFVGAVEKVLSEEEKVQLEKFLATHPAKRAELDLLRQTILEPEQEIVFEGKAGLKKSVLITETNFEEYAVAALEGELSGDALVQFNAFLAAHQQYKNEFELFAKTKLQPEAEIVFENKASLKKTPLVLTADNFDEVAISSVEGLLNAEEEKVFVAAMSANADYQKSFGLYAQTKLQPDEYIVFDEKEMLKREEKDRGIFWWMMDIRFSAAAVIALLIGIFWFNYSSLMGVKDNHANDFAAKDDHNSNPISIVPNSSDAFASNVPKAGSITLPKLNKKVQPLQHKNISSPHYVASVVTPEKTTFATVDSRNSNKPLNTNYETNVDFSDAYYDGTNFGVASNSTSTSITPGQYAMRWMKDKLDRSADKNADEDIYKTVSQNKSENVTGFDLTSSAVHAIGEATGSNLKLARETQGTILTVGKYHVWLNRTAH